MSTIEAGRFLADRYRVDRPLGSGGMATVYAGTDSRLGRPVAVKCLRPELSDPAARRRFEIESRTAARLNHPNIVAVHDAGEDGQCAFMIMELLPGRTLADEMAAGPMDTARCTDIAHQVLAALSAAHQAGVVHRDIKPSNLLITADGAVKVADFGIATSLGGASDLTRTGELVGTASYIAPERLAGSPATAASDLYSLGAVLYECLAGRRMFSADDPFAYARHVLDTEPTPIAAVAPRTDPALAAAVERVLAKDPGRRYATASEMQAALAGSPPGLDETIEWGQPAVAPDDPLVRTDVLLRPTPPRPGRDRRLLGIGAAAAALALVIIIAIGAGHSSGHTSTPTTTPATSAANVTPTAVSPSVPAPLARDLAGLQKAVSSK